MRGVTARRSVAPGKRRTRDRLHYGIAFIIGHPGKAQGLPATWGLSFNTYSADCYRIIEYTADRLQLYLPSINQSIHPSFPKDM